MIICIFLSIPSEFKAQSRSEFPKKHLIPAVKSVDEASLLLNKIDSLKYADPELALLIADSCNYWFDIDQTPIEKAKCHFWRAWLTIKLVKRGEASAFALAQARISRKLFRDAGTTFWLARSNELIATIYNYQGKIEEAQKLLDQAKALLPQIKNQSDSLFLLAEVLNLQGLFYLQNRNSEAIERFFESSKLYDELDHQVGSILCFQNLATYYYKTEQPDSSKAMAQIAVEKGKLSGLDHELGISFLKLAQSYELDHYISKDTSSLNRAFHFFDKALGLVNRNKLEVYHNLIYATLSQCRKPPCIEEALVANIYLDTAIKVAEQEQNLAGLYDLIPYGQEICIRLNSCNELINELKVSMGNVVDSTKIMISNASNQFSEAELEILAESANKKIRNRQNIIWAVLIFTILAGLAFLYFFSAVQDSKSKQRIIS